MVKPSVLHWPWRPTGYESDAGFRELIERLCRSGLFYAGTFAIGLTVVHLAVHGLVLDFELTWSYEGRENPRSQVALWDKSLIVVLGLVAMGMSRRQGAGRWARLVAGLLVMVICLAILIDDILNGDVSFSAAYFALVMLVAVNTIPFKPWHTLTLGIATIGLIAGGKLFFPEMLGVAGVEMGKTQMLYMGLVVVVLTPITSLLYRFRYDQYAARKSTEALNRILEDRTHALEIEKRKTVEQAQRLATMEELKSRFFSNITHQFRTPLTLILGPTQDALEQRFGPLDERLGSQLDLVHRNGLRLQHLIDQLLDLARIDAGGMQLDMQREDLQAFLEATHRAFIPMAERKGIVFEYSTNRPEVWTRFDADVLEKVLSNLLSNAFKFTPNGGKIRLSLRVRDGIEMHVRDSGPGIPESELSHVFDRFHQARGVAGDAAGSGIGLALAKELTELHGGTITAESEVGFGTHLVVTLPYLAEEVEERQTARVDATGDGFQAPDLIAVRATAPHESAYAILIIDDNEDVRLYLRSHLEPRYTVLEASGGREGIALACAHRPALVICDVMMPDIDGLEVCHTLKDRAATRNIPIVLLTARASEEAKIEGLEARADDYMFKPFSATELLTRVENLIELRRMLGGATTGAALLAPSVPEVASTDEKFLEGVRTAIEEHMSNTNFGVDWLADEVALSARQLQRRLQATVRLSAAGLIRMMRLQRAAQLLERRAGTVSEIAYMVGFQDAGHFARLFKQTYGLTPREYAEQHASHPGPTGTTQPMADG